MRELRQLPSERMERRDPKGLDQTNYATHKRMVERAQQVIRQIPDIIARRQEFNRDLLEWWDVLRARHNEHSRIYNGGISELYLPATSDSVEKLVDLLAEDIFPRPALLSVESADADLVFAEHIYKLMLHFAEQAQIELQIPAMIRQGLACGISPVKIDWMTRELPNYRLEQFQRSDTGESIFAPVEERIFAYDGPTFEVRNMQRWYIWPFTAQTILEAHILFELVEKKWDHLKAMEDAGMYHKVDRIEALANTDATRIHGEINELLEGSGLTLDQERKRKNGIYELTELYTYMPLPGTKGQPVPVQIIAYGTIILSLKQTPFWHQTPPYLFWRPKAEHENVHGRSHVKHLAPMNYAASTALNLGLDNLYMQNSPFMALWTDRLAVDPEAIEYVPGGVLETTADPHSIASFHRPPSTVQESFFMASSLLGMTMDSAGAPPIVQGKLGGGRDLTATTSSILAGGATAGVRSMAKSFAMMVMTPGVRMMYRLAQQFMSLRKQGEISGISPAPDMPLPILLGDHTLNWSTASMATERAQTSMIALQTGLPGDPGNVRAQQQAQPGEAPAAPGIAPQIAGAAGLGNSEAVGQVRGI